MPSKAQYQKTIKELLTENSSLAVEVELLTKNLKRVQQIREDLQREVVKLNNTIASND